MNIRQPVLFALAVLLAVTAGVQAERIECTAQAFHAKIAALNNACPAGGETVTFNCSNTTILIPEGTAEQRYIHCDGIAFDGEDRNVTFQLDPPCNLLFQNSCPEQSAVLAEWLLRFRGDGGTFKNLTMARFWEGIYADPGATNTVIENSVLVGGCDDVFTNQEGAVNTVLRDNTIQECCDKCLQLRGREVSQTSYPDWDVQLINNRFESGLNPFHIEDGRVLAKGNTILDLHPDALYDCAGPWLGHVSKPGWNPIVYFEDNTIEGCKQGLRITGSASLVSQGGNRFIQNRVRGASVEDNARAMFQNDTFRGNGGNDTGVGHLGGLVVGGSAILDAGGGSVTIDGQTHSSQGNIVFDNNQAYGTPRLDLNNETVAQTTVKAEGNHWGDADPSDQVAGAVDYSPVNGGTGGDDDGDGDGPPPPPSGLVRTDTPPPE